MNPINVFNPPYEIFEKIKLSNEEVLAHTPLGSTPVLEKNGKLLLSISKPIEGAEYIVNMGVDNGLEFHIDKHLESSSDFKLLLEKMPDDTPHNLVEYQLNYETCNKALVDAEIKYYGTILPKGQMLYHGGFWEPTWGDKIVLDSPLSTTFCPQVALRETDHKGKSCRNNQVDIWLIRINSEQIKGFVYDPDSGLGHEKEVLFSSGMTLTKMNTTRVRDDYEVPVNMYSSKKIPVNIIEIDLS